MNDIRLKKILNDSIEKLLSFQKLDGGFVFYSWSDGNENHALIRQSIFPSALILTALADVKYGLKKVNEIKNKICRYLLKEKSSDWSFNYWERDSAEYTNQPYPDDLDDTFCALSGIFKSDAEKINGAAFAKISSILITLEQNPGGPYRTWLVDNKAKKIWKDYDIAVNSNIAYFLKLQEINLPNINKLIEKSITENNLSSPYYSSSASVIYFISRFYNGELKNKLAKIAIDKFHNSNFLDKCFLLNALVNFGEPLEIITTLAKILLKTYKKHSASLFPFVNEQISGNSVTVSGSPAITLVYFIEFMNKYLTLRQNNSPFPVKKGEESEIKNKIIKETVLSFPKDNLLHEQAALFMNKILEKDSSSEITLIPYYLYKAISPKKNINKELLIKLGKANLLGWIAYTIYDCIADNDKPADITLFTIANIAARKSFQSYNFNGIDHDLEKIINSSLDMMDLAILKENKKFRIKSNFSISKSTLPLREKELFKKSIGHITGSLCLLTKLGYSIESAEYQSVSNLLKHYLNAKQICDDAHDWQEDLQNWMLNPVSITVLNDFFKIYKIENCDLQKDMQKLEEVFWNVSIDRICKIIKNHISNSREIMKNNKSFFVEPQYLEQLLSRLDDSVIKTLSKRDDMRMFLQTINVDNSKNSAI